MKKVVKSLVVLTSVLAMGACSPDKKETATSSSTKATEKTEATSGASEQSYTCLLYTSPSPRDTE